jgi:hypothetical protein
MPTRGLEGTVSVLSCVDEGRKGKDDALRAAAWLDKE